MAGREGGPLGLYVHVPFCASVCPYCHFSRALVDDAVKARYLRAVEQEILAAGRAASPVDADTIFFGGGTPSLLEPSDVARLIGACRTAFRVAPDAEVTLEANPDSATGARLAGYRAAGVNRLSLGVQSFRDEELVRLGRVHDAARARAAVADARGAGFDNISLDLMLWLPGQTVADCLESVDALAAVSPEHASLYLLDLDEVTPLRDTAAQAGWPQAPDDEAAEMYEQAMARLEAAGFEQYEISNLARRGRRSRHNLKYWTGGEWMGFGAAAHSTAGGCRWRNVPDTQEYVALVAAGRSPAIERRRLPDGERLEEALFMGLRLADGVDLAGVRRRFGLDVWSEYGYRLTSCVEAGLLRVEPGRLRLTRRGMLLATEVMALFLRSPQQSELTASRQGGPHA